jgi:hypothetical protein
MRRHLNKQLGWGTAALCGIATLGLTQAAPAQDFFSGLFNAFGGSRPPVVQMPFANQMPFSNQVPFANQGERAPYVRRSEPRVRRIRSSSSSSSGQAFCVRTCDGRYFPITGSDQDSRAASCNSFCPASQTNIVYGNDIDSATTDSGKRYSELPNAFRYRNEIVKGCTCNGKDQFGLAHVDVNDDPTLRKGDIVASAEGLMSVRRTPDKRGALNLTRLPASVAARYQRLRVLARE